MKTNENKKVTAYLDKNGKVVGIPIEDKKEKYSSFSEKLKNSVKGIKDQVEDIKKEMEDELEKGIFEEEKDNEYQEKVEKGDGDYIM